MLSYRHAFHAGNHADVLKHCILVAMLRHMNRKDKPWWYVDTHAGAGIYDLHSDYARKVGEYEGGIGRLWQRNDLPEPVADYVDQVRALNPGGTLRLYPGSPWLASRLMRAEDQLRLFELHGTDAELLRQTFVEAARHIKVEKQDGLAGLKAVLPPQPRRGVILIDPSYEMKDDYRQVPQALKEGLGRFATGTYAVWYPQLQRMEARDLPEKLKRLPVKSWLHVSLSVRKPAADGFGMHGSGMFIVNPPWQLAEQLQATLPWLAASGVRQRIVERWPALRPAYRLLYNLVASALVLPPLALTWLYPGAPLWHWPAWIAWGAFGIAAAGFLVSMRWYDGLDFIGLRQWRQRGTPTECRDAFVLSPLHRYVRHPWYSLGLLYLWTRDLNAGWLAATITLTLYIVIGSRLEERKLAETFGEPYRRYLARVPGLVPMPGRHLSEDEARTMTCEVPAGNDKRA